MVNDHQQISFHGHQLLLDHRKAVFIPQQKILVVADLHWGKEIKLGRAGIALPRQAIQNDYLTLRNLCRNYEPQMLVVVGDLINSAQDLTDSLMSDIAELRKQLPPRVVLTRGNHDRGDLPAAWNIEIVPQLEHEGLCFVHDAANCQQPTLMGHTHPVAILRDQGQRLRVPCFWQRPFSLCLPSFGILTGGHPVVAGEGDRIHLVTEEAVISL